MSTIKGKTYKEYRDGAPPALLRVLLAQRDEPLGKALCFFGLGPCGCDGFVLDERGDEVAKKSLSVRRLAAQMAIFGCAAGHCAVVLRMKGKKFFEKLIKKASGLTEKRN
jgi:hypothetical protein